MHFCKYCCIFGVLTNHLILTKMKKLKLIFGLLMVTAFVAVTVLSYSTSNDQAIRKDGPDGKGIILPTNG